MNPLRSVRRRVAPGDASRTASQPPSSVASWLSVPWINVVWGTTIALFVGSLLWWSVDRGEPFRKDADLLIDVKVGAAPLVGEWQRKTTWSFLVPMIVGLLIIEISEWSRSWRMRTVAFAYTILAGLFAVTLAATEGWSHVMDPVVHRTEYLANLPKLPGLWETLRSWSDPEFLINLSVHAKGHPPGFTLLLQALNAGGLGFPWVVALVIWVALASIIPATLLLVAQVVRDSGATARRLAPFLALGPFVVWSATSADAVYAAVLMWSAAALACAVASETTRRELVWSIVGGVGFGLLLFSTYGGLSAGLVPIVIVACHGLRRAVRLLLGASLGLACVVGVFAVGGFWWVDGWSTTKHFYGVGTAQFRPYSYFVVANLAALAIALGPATVGGWMRGPRPLLARTNRPLMLLVGSALLGVLVADVSGFSKGEVERIWLPFMPILTVPVVRLQHRRLWLLLQLGATLALQAWLRTKW